MTQRRPDVSVVICTWSEERWDPLIDAIASVRSQTLAPSEIVVVVDHNRPLALRLQASVPDVVVVENREPFQGIAGTRNSGVQAARGNIVAFMDDDATAAPDWLERHINWYSDPAVLGIGGPVVPVWLGGRPTWFPEEFDWVVGCTYRGMPTVPTPVQRLIGCNMSFRRELFSVMGNFRSDMGRIGSRPVAGDETEFCIRAMQRWPSRFWIYDPQARVHHRVPAQRSSWRYFCSRCYAEGISKAEIARLVGPRSGLAIERAYTFRTLPRGVIRDLGDVLLHADLAGLARAATIAIGLAVTALGYVQHMVEMRSALPGDAQG